MRNPGLRGAANLTWGEKPQARSEEKSLFTERTVVLVLRPYSLGSRNAGAPGKTEHA
jgi:hypothetical protein